METFLKERMVLSIKFRDIALVAYLFFLVPIVIFIFGWLHWYYALFFTLVLLGGFVWLFRLDYLHDKGTLSIPVVHFVLIALLFGFYVAMSGSCGVSAGLNDIPWRNAILRDLIDYSWPVIYGQTGYALAYYLAFWMVPALVGKLFGWGAALFALWLWETGILVTSFLLISHVLKADKPSTFWMIAVVFMLFSGLNLVGAAVTEMVDHNLYGFGLNGNESYCNYFFNGESTNFYYRSNIDCIEESYNQILLWLAVPLMLQNRKIHSFMFIGLILVPFSPWATIGIIPLMLVLGAVELAGYVKETSWSKALVKTLREIFSPANMGALIGCALVFAAFFLTGEHMSGSSAAASSDGSFGILTLSKFHLSNWAIYVMFCLLEFGIFAFFVYPKYKRHPLFWAVIVLLLVAPFIWVGTISGRDFCMDASLPALFVLMIMMMGYIKEELMGKPLGLRNLAFVAVLVIALSSPIMQMCSQVQMMYEGKSLYVLVDSTDITTFNGVELSRVSNFICSQPQETFFFKYLAR